jgi:hypothetical protein
VSIARKDPTLNDAIEYLDDLYIRADKNQKVAYSMLDDSDKSFIYGETEQCLDLRYYLENYHCIQDENGNWKSFYPWFEYQEILYEAIEEELAANGQCKIIVVKPRQSGISTWTAAAVFHRTITMPHSYSMIVGQNGDTSEHLYNMSINAYHALPWWIRPEFLYKTKGDEIVFQREDDAERSVNPGLGSILKCSNAMKMSGVAIGRSLRSLHGSEVSRWPDDGMFEADIKPSMNARDTFAILESTGFGRQGFFYEHWRGSVEGDTGYRAVFIPVYRSKKYYLPFNRRNPVKNEALSNAFTLRDDEEKFNSRVEKEEHFSIPKEFWNFHRIGMLAAKRGQAKAGFIESYPLTPAQAFQASGICAFDRESLEEQEMKYICKPIFAGEISLAFDNKTPNTDMIREVMDDEILPKRKGDRPSARLHIWELPEVGETYYVGSDSALGVYGGDYSVASVFRCGQGSASDTQVAEWWGHCPPEEFARINCALGYWYNGAEVATEYQGPGISTGDKLVELDYPNLYRERMKDRPGGAYKPYFHFVTNIKTRDAIISTMNEALLHHNRKGDPGVILRSVELLDEMIDFGSTGGRMEGQGNHDDSVFALMIALYCMRETTTHLKGTANDRSSSEHVGDIKVYGVYDNIMRQRGQYQDRMVALGVIEGKPGWTVQPILICKANTMYSPTYDDPNSAEFKLRHAHGLSSDEIVPALVSSFKAAYDQAAIGGNSSNDSDW